MNHANLLDVWTHLLDPMRAEVRFRLHAADPGIELRGRLMGPRCRFATTVEVAYPLRPLGSTGEFAAIIPEPSLWDPAKPFVYEGPIEWVNREGETMEARPRICFRSVKLGPKGLFLNNKLLQVRGKELPATEVPAEDDLLELRRQGCNALLTDVGQADLSELADRLGFLLILRDKPGDNGQESFCCQLVPRRESGRVKLASISRQADGSFTLV